MPRSMDSQQELDVPKQFHRKKAKWKQMFLNCLGNFAGLNVKKLHFEKRATGSAYILQGLLLVLDHRGRKVYSRCVDVQYVYDQANGGVSFRLRNRWDYSREKLQYIWTDNGRWSRIKTSPPKRNGKERNKPKLHEKPPQLHSDCKSNLVLEWSKKGREGYRSFGAVEEKQPEVAIPSERETGVYSDDSSEDENSYFPEEPPPKRPYFKSVNRSFKSYLLSHGRVTRNTKAWTREMETLTFATYDCSGDNMDNYDDNDLPQCDRQISQVTFGDFCRTPLVKQRSKGSSSTIETLLFESKSPNVTESAYSETDHTLSIRASDPQEPSMSPESVRESQMTNVVMVRLIRAHIRPDVLCSEFQLDYREAPCKPRRFLLNISRLFYQHVILMSRLRIKHIPKLDLSTYLVFTFSQTINSEVDEYRMHVNSAWSKLSTHVILKEHNASKPFSPIQELIHDVIHAVDGIDLNQFKPRKDTKIPPRPSRPVCLFNILSSVAQWETVTLCLPYTTEWYEDHIIQSHGADSDSSSIAIEDIFDILRNKFQFENVEVTLGPNNSEMCGVCLSEFRSGTTSFPLAMTRCSHWFCEECWKSRVLIQLRNGHRPYEVPCPEKGCPSRLDPVTILCVLSVEDIRRMNQIKIDNYVTTKTRVKMCPSSTCHRLLWSRPLDMSSKTAVIVTCDCSAQICFDCQLQPHWPAPCSIAKKYHKELSSNNRDVLVRLLSQMEFPEVVMRGKRCPKCKLFIPQSSSLKIYTCSCGCQFCWRCGLDINNNEAAHSLCVESFVQSDNVLKDIVNNGQLTGEPPYKTSRWLGTALEHRKMRHPEVLLAMYSMAESLAKNITNYHQNGRYVGDIDSAAQGWSKYLTLWARENYTTIHVSRNSEHDSLSFNENGRSVSRASSVSSLFNESEVFDSPIFQATENIVQVKLELHHVIEYTSILLDQSVLAPAKLVQCLERAEDLSTALGILLQNKQNCRQVLPTFIRLKAKVRQIIGHILTTTEEIPAGVFRFEEDNKCHIE